MKKNPSCTANIENEHIDVVKPKNWFFRHPILSILFIGFIVLVATGLEEAPKEEIQAPKIVLEEKNEIAEVPAVEMAIPVIEKKIEKFEIYKEIDVSSGFENTRVSSLLSVPYDRFRLFIEIPKGLSKDEVEIVAKEIVREKEQNSDIDTLYLFFSDFKNLDGYNVARVTWDVIGTAEEKYKALEADDHSRNTLKFDDFKETIEIDVSSEQKSQIAKEIKQIESKLFKEIPMEQLEEVFQKKMNVLKKKYNLTEDEFNIIYYGM